MGVARVQTDRQADAVPNAPVLLDLRGLTKRFGALVACDGVDLTLRRGEVLALLGENGAGKSTLMKTLFGVYAPDAGEVMLDGRPVAFASPRDAMAAGLGMVFQKFSLIPAMSVHDNLALAWPGTPWYLGRRNRRAAGVLDRLAELAPNIDPAARLGDLSVAEQQLVELAKVLNIDARLVILDEPTAVLTPAEARRLHSLIRVLSSEGVAVILITHKLVDVEAAADRVVVLRRGRVVTEGRVQAFNRAALVTAMVGNDTGTLPPPPPLDQDPAPSLVLKGLSARGAQIGIESIDISVGAGEIVGVAGVAGNGQSVLAETVAGVLPALAGDILLHGQSIARRQGEPPRALPIGYVPEDARTNGVAEGLNLLSNLGFRGLSPRLSGEAALKPAEAATRLADFDVRPPEPHRKAATLSGGNLQKLVLARETGVARAAQLLVYPTMGLDVAAAEAVYRRMLEAAAGGSAILWISEEIDDLLALAHRIVVMREGRVETTFRNDGSIGREALGAAMTGGTP